MAYQQGLSQQQKQVQKLAMTQQLQQSIQILQYNAEGLQQFLQQKSLENPLLAVRHTTQGQANLSGSQRRVDNFMNAIPDTTQSLFDYLLEQVHLTMRDTPLRDLVLFLLEYVDLNGYLRITNEEISAKTGADAVQILDAITLLQQLDPPGVGARNLQESLLLQTESDNSAPNLAYIVLEEDFTSFVERKWNVIATKYRVDIAEIQHIFDYVQTLTPRPGAAFSQTQNNFVRPELVVHAQGDELQLNLTNESQPQLVFQQHYFDRMLKTNDREVTEYMKEKKQEFEWLRKSVGQRGNTILRVGQEIIQRQHEFFFNVKRPLKPLLLRDVATKLGVHESTVSRTVNGKYLQTDFGIFELKHFFTNAVGNQQADSAASVKQQLQDLIAAEDKHKPLSDQHLVALLGKAGVTISRRTVAKYRESLGIAASSKRKRFD
ncbi:RNA polymerase factor sigma-54 [Loigolactobacillus coryniformis]|uniref:RNA polymerase factor sigma-54 n=1 Tax=Loigolactobacillus coryniformis TaxID=1610 RepID=UPI001C5F80A4|nr:RNA polymerase factor sigma-54 [Loigolactobacillus coryniformis]MBW4803066.1 RNA polymerase factor sigma-54 [Loigolactobacillus coryniformis subsp. torquens]MBW4805761.1 RNA polymerase factor sigma-54 [Loigolactobacillus coryniformis subsp. torquens]